MYARLRQKFSIANASTTVTTTTSLGNNATSLLMKDLVRLMTGAITSTAGLNNEIWDIANSEVINTVAAGWAEYQTNYSTTSTNIPNTAVTNNNLMYLRCLSANNTYKYTGMSWTANGNTTSYYKLLIPFDVTDYTGNPTLTFRDATPNTASSAPASQEGSTVLQEHILYVTPRCIFWATTRLPSTQPYVIQTFLEYPNTPLSAIYNHPNQVAWSLYNGYGASTTGNGSSFNNTGYNTVGGYSTTGVGPIAGGSTNANYGMVYSNFSTAPTGGFNSIWSTTAGTAETSTLKPATYGSMSNTVDSSGNLISVPAMPLIHYPGWDSVYDLSTLTGVYGTRSGLGANGDTLTVNGQPYAYVNASTMGYLIPRQ